jgi:hypothetical protein
MWRTLYTRTACCAGHYESSYVEGYIICTQKNLASFCICEEEYILINVESQNLVLVRLRIYKYVSGLVTL